MGLKWTRQMTKLIIYLWRRNVCLWDTNNAHYAIQASRQEALESITKGVAKIASQVTVNDVRSKIHVLRTQYRKEYNTVEQNKRDAACGKIDEYPRNGLWCFDLLNFLLPVTEKKHNISNDPCSGAEDSSQNSFEGSNFDPLEFMDSEDEFQAMSNGGDETTQQHSEDAEETQNSLCQFQVVEPIQNNEDHIERASTIRSSDDNAEIQKLEAETRYYNEMADLAHAKRILVELQSVKLRLELDEMNNS